MPSATEEIRIGNRTFQLDSVQWIEMQSADSAEVTLADGRIEQFVGEEATALSGILSRRMVKPARRAVKS